MDLNGVKSPQMDGKRLRQHVELMFGGPLSPKKEEEKCYSGSYLLIWCVKRGTRHCQHLVQCYEDDEKKFKTYLEKLATHVKPKCHLVYSRCKFNRREEAESETVVQFVTDLKLLVRDCSFKEPDEMIRDRFVF